MDDLENPPNSISSPKRPLNFPRPQLFSAQLSWNLYLPVLFPVLPSPMRLLILDAADGMNDEIPSIIFLEMEWSQVRQIFVKSHNSRWNTVRALLNLI